MAAAAALKSSTTALVVMDLQRYILGLVDASQAEALVARTAGLLQAARAAGLLVVHVGLGFRPGFPELAPEHPMRARVQATGAFAPGNDGAEFVAAVAPAKNEPVVYKRRVGPFQGTDLDMLLRARGTKTVVFCGISTSGCVLSAVRYAYDADYAVVVASDCCLDRDPEVHRVLIDKIFAGSTTVKTAAQIAADLVAAS